MAKERRNWEEDSPDLADVEKKSPSAANPGSLLVGKASESSTLRGSEQGRHDEQTNGHLDIATREGAENASHHSEGTAV